MEEIRPNMTMVTAPPPPQEVRVRTMKTDLSTMAANGGGAPRFEKVKVSGLTAAAAQKFAQSSAEMPAVAPVIPAATPSASPSHTRGKNNLVLVIVLVIILMALAVVGWLVYSKFQG